MDTVKEAADLVVAMTDTELNQFVDFIREEMTDRRRRRNRQALLTVKVDDRVKITGKMKPQYLTGLTGVVTEKKQSRVTITLDRGPTKKFTRGIVTLPASALTVLS